MIKRTNGSEILRRSNILGTNQRKALRESEMEDEDVEIEADAVNSEDVEEGSEDFKEKLLDLISSAVKSKEVSVDEINERVEAVAGDDSFDDEEEPLDEDEEEEPLDEDEEEELDEEKQRRRRVLEAKARVARAKKLQEARARINRRRALSEKAERPSRRPSVSSRRTFNRPSGRR